MNRPGMFNPTPAIWALALGIILVSVIGVVLHSLGGLS